MRLDALRAQLIGRFAGSDSPALDADCLLAFVLVMPFAALIGGVVFAPLSFAVGVLAGGIASAAAAFSRFARS